MEVSMAKSKTERGRFSSRKKMDVVLRVLRGDDLDLVSREAGITAATRSAWRDDLLASGQTGLKSRAADGRDDALARLKALVGDLTMRRELSREAVRKNRGQRAISWGDAARFGRARVSPINRLPVFLLRKLIVIGVRLRWPRNNRHVN
jgi:transposase